MSIEELVKSVACKINYYIDVKQREDGFNLSGSPLRSRKPLYIPAPPQRLYGSNSIKRNRFSIYNTLQEQPSILLKRRQRTQNYIPAVIGSPKRDKIVQTASKFLVSLGFPNTNSLHQHRKQHNTENKNHKLPSINDRKNYQGMLLKDSFKMEPTKDFIYDDTGSFCKEEIILDYGKITPDPPPAINSTQIPDSHPESLNPCPPKEVKPSYSVSYSADPTPESYGVLMHCATQTDSDNILIQRYPPNNVDQEYKEITSGKETKYIVVVKTGNVLGASTRAQIKIILCGTEGKTGAISLLKSETNKIKFQKGKEDHFILKTFNVGYIEKIRIGHNRLELPYAWFLDYVTVYDQTEKWMYKFPCGQWFSGEDGDRQTYREILSTQNMAMVEDIQNANEEDILQWLAKTENHDKNREKNHQEIASEKIQTEIHLNEHSELDTPRSDLSSLSSNIGNRFHQGTLISVQNQVTTGTQTNKIPSRHYNLARDFHQPQNNSPAFEQEQKEVHSEPVSFSFTRSRDSVSSSKTNYKADDDEPSQSWQNYSDMDPNFHNSVVNSSLSTTSSPSSSSSLSCSSQISQKRLPKSDSFCDCYVLGKEKSCQCGEEDSYFDWVWDEDSKSSACHLKQDHREVMFHMDYSCGTAAVRGTVPMKENQHYWEVKMTSTVYGTDMMVGVSTMNIDLNKYRHAFCSLLGRDEDSWGLSYTGVTHHKARKELYTSKFGQGDIIGVHLDMWLGTMSYYKNRRPLGIAYRGLQGKSLYPVVSSTAARSGMKVVKCRSFPTSLQFACCQALRRYIPPHLDVLEVVDLPPGLRSFLQNKVSWLLQSCVFPTQKNLVNTGKKRSCSEPSGCYEDDDRCKRRCLWEVCPLQGMS
ncbi:SPSB3 [Acanthosepion pharaonis]|uniref:SPRY domain-containing SOCS box protein 3 n=1 Tax=Acanthosepion pharaonis TaxID=158019 RepID=A0A812END0_ACAPH|nr:SPSB3 [Sepia pharaonis]